MKNCELKLISPYTGERLSRYIESCKNNECMIYEKEYYGGYTNIIQADNRSWFQRHRTAIFFDYN